jgi:hypothetical protein
MIWFEKIVKKVEAKDLEDRLTHGKKAENWRKIPGLD